MKDVVPHSWDPYAGDRARERLLGTFRAAPYPLIGVRPEVLGDRGQLGLARGLVRRGLARVCDITGNFFPVD